MADYDDDVRGATDAADPFAPVGPRRSNFTPAPTDSESLEAAAKIFNDDAIAAALAADLARVLASPLIDRTSIDENKPVEQEASSEPFDEQPTADDYSVYEPVLDESLRDEPALSIPELVVPAAPVAPPAPPEWALPLFGQPTLAQPTPVAPVVRATPIDGIGEEDEQREEAPPAYLGAPPPTVPPADVPPPPGYAASSSPFAPYTPVSEPDLSGGYPASTPVVEPERPSDHDDDDDQISATLSAIEKLQAQLELRDREARERASEDSPFATLPPPTDRPFSTLPPPTEPSVAIRSPFAPPEPFIEPPRLGAADNPVFLEPLARLEPPAWEIPEFDQSVFSPGVDVSPNEADLFEIPSVTPVAEPASEPLLAPRAFDDLLIGLGESTPRPLDQARRAEQPAQPAVYPIDSPPEGKTSFWKRSRGR